MEKKVNLKNVARELKVLTDTYPFDPTKLLPVGVRHRRDLVIGSCEFRIQFTKTLLISRHIYQLSIGCPSGNPNDIPDCVIKQVREAFFGDGGGISVPSVLGNSIQFADTCCESGERR